MADQEWLARLAEARFVGGAWVHGDPAAVQRLAAARLTRAADALADLARDYAEALSELTRGRRQIKVLDIAPQGGAGGGFLLLLGRCQLNLERQGPELAVTLITVSGFQRLPRPLYRFAPRADTFGSLAWRLAPAAPGGTAEDAPQNGLIMTDELIIKRLFEDLTRAAGQPGDGVSR